MKTKKFDCVEMKRQGAEDIFQKISKMSKQQELDFWNKRTQSLRNHQKNHKITTRQENDFSL